MPPRRRAPPPTPPPPSHAPGRTAIKGAHKDLRDCKTAPVWAFQEGASTVCWLVAVLMTAFYSDGVRSVLRKYIPVWRERARRVPETKRMYDLFEEMILDDPKFDAQRRDARFRTHRLLSDVLNHVTEEQKKKLGVPRDRRHEDPFDDLGCYAQYYDPWLYSLMGLDVPQDILFTSVSGGKIDDVNTHRIHDLKPDQKTLEHHSPKIICVTNSGNFPRTLPFNGCTYTLDGLHVLARAAGKKSHWISGVTCHGQRYLHNGWEMGGVRGVAQKPCPLFKYDWANRDGRAFRLDSTNCRMDFFDPARPPTKPLEGSFDYHFNLNAALLCVCFYVRTDPPVTAAECVPDAEAAAKRRDPASCARDQIVNVNTNLCVKKDGKVGRTTPWAKVTIKPARKQPARAAKAKTATSMKATTKPKKASPPPSTPKPAKDRASRAAVKACDDPTKIRNPDSGRCVARTGKIGRRILMSAGRG